MGWNTYYGVGGIFSEQTILSVARSLLRDGLAKAGYRIVWLDYGWASGARTSTGQLVLNHGQWPHGLEWLTSWLHAHGLEAGIYTDAGRSGCYGNGVGSYGHYRQDADQFAAWGFDAVKVDFCGAGQEGLAPEPLYTQFANAIRDNSSGRPMILNVCNFWTPGQIDGKLPSYANSSFANALWAPAVAQSRRTDTDIGGTGKVPFANVLRNLNADAAHPKAAGPGHWNDPDYLGPQLGMTPGGGTGADDDVGDRRGAADPRERPAQALERDAEDAREPARARSRPGPPRDPGNGGRRSRFRRGVGQAAERRAPRSRAAEHGFPVAPDHGERRGDPDRTRDALPGAEPVERQALVEPWDDHRAGGTPFGAAVRRQRLVPARARV